MKGYSHRCHFWLVKTAHENCSMRVLAIFTAFDTTVAPRQRSYKEGENVTDGLALARATCTNLVCLERLTPWTLA